ncbi:MAG TPA: ornithine carbamoyltransferase [Pseudogracilibacillus sp.]|nr:ornithine carbamoyltransferase [Pseudogracilibacillus sp.]
MKSKLQGKDLLQIDDYSKEELLDLITFAIQLKNMNKLGEPHRYLEGKTLAMIFEKSSTRTRVSFETGMFQLGGAAQFLSGDELQLGNGETIADTAQVLSRYVDAIMIRTFGHEIVEELAQYSTVPVINGLTDDAHPCQVLADFMTIYEKKGTLEGLNFAFVGDGNNMSQSLMIGSALVGMNFTIATPKGNEVKRECVATAQKYANETGANIVETNDPYEAVKNADVIYTDVWASMGWEGDLNARLQAFKPYQVNDGLANAAKNDYLFMHCLPAKRGEEVTNSVIDGSNSVVFDQAENRLHVQKAILASVI